MSSDKIAHEGRIIAIDPQLTTVEIISESACSACHAKGLCSLGESKRKIVEVPTTAGNWAVGQTVNVLLCRTMGLKAVAVSYAVPLFVLLLALMLCLALGVGELLSGLLSLGSIALYYVVLWFFRDKLKNEIKFYIEEK